MPRGRRSTPDLEALERELVAVKERQAQIRRVIRLNKGNNTEIRKLQDKLEKQLAAAKWTVQQIHELQPAWDDVGFYQTVRAVQPTPRGRRPRAVNSDAV